MKILAKQERPQLNYLQEFEFLKTRVFAGNVTTGKVVALRPVIENLGLDWSSALKRIKRNEGSTQLWSSEKAIGADGKTYDMICMPIQSFQEWLWQMDPDSSSNFKKDVWESYKKGLVLHLMLMLEISLNEIQRLKQIEIQFDELKQEAKELIETQEDVDHTAYSLKEKKKIMNQHKEKMLELIMMDTSQMKIEFNKEENE